MTIGRPFIGGLAVAAACLLVACGDGETDDSVAGGDTIEGPETETSQAGSTVVPGTTVARQGETTTSGAVSSTGSPPTTIGDGTADPPGEPAAPSSLTPADDGRVISMTIGDVVDLVVPDPFAPDPVVEGTSLEVIEVVNVQASDNRQWELQAVRPGTTVLRANGQFPYVIEFEVSP